MAIQWVEASGGAAPTLAYTIGSETSTTLTVTRGSVSVGTLQTWDLEYREQGSGTWLEVQSDIPAGTTSVLVEGLTPETVYEFRARPTVLLDGEFVLGPTGETTVAPPTLPIFTNQAGLEASFDGVNDGSIWFSAGGAERCFSGRIRNNSGRAATSMNLQLINSNNGTATSTKIRIGRGGSGNIPDTWGAVSDTINIPAGVPDGGITPTGIYVSFPLSPPLADGDDLVLRIQGPAGLPWSSAAPSFASTPSTVSSPFTIGDTGSLIGSADFVSSGIGVCMFFSGVQWESAGAGIARGLVFSDSRGAGVPPLADPQATLRDGIWHYINTKEKTLGTRFCIGSNANGGYTFDMFASRLARFTSLGHISDMCDFVLLDVLSWNQIPSSTGEADAIWAEFNARKAALAALSIPCIPLINTPQGYNKQGEGRDEAWDYLRGLAIAEGCIDFSTYCADAGNPRTFNDASLGEGVHLSTAFMASEPWITNTHAAAVAELTSRGII